MEPQGSRQHYMAEYTTAIISKGHWAESWLDDRVKEPEDELAVVRKMMGELGFVANDKTREDRTRRLIELLVGFVRVRLAMLLGKRYHGVRLEEISVTARLHEGRVKAEVSFREDAGGFYTAVTLTDPLEYATLNAILEGDALKDDAPKLIAHEISEAVIRETKLGLIVA